MNSIPFDKYNTVDELIEEIDNNFDIEFEYAGKQYSICPTGKGPSIAERNNEETYMTFINGSDLVEKYLINGKPLKDIVQEVKVISH